MILAGRLVRYAARITRRQRTLFNLLFTMKIIRSKSFTATRPWGALDIANMGGITTRLH